MIKTFEYIRDGVGYLITEYKIKELYLPYYLCDVIRHKVVSVGCKPRFYHIDDNFLPIQNFPNDAWILYPNYFGICSKNVEILANEYPKLIVDNAHSFYSKPRGFASIYSARKFGLSSNSYLVLGEEDWQKTDEFALARKNKFLELDKKYSNTNLINIDLESIPFCYPYLASNIDIADKLASSLQAQGMIIYRYWNPLPKSYPEYKFYSCLVPIPLN